MFKLVILVLALAMGYMIIQQFPDIRRYMKIRSM